MDRIYLHGDNDLVIEVLSLSKDQVHFLYDGRKYQVNRGTGNTFELNGKEATCLVSDKQTTVDGVNVELESWKLERSVSVETLGGDMLSPMPGKILKLCAAVGQELKAGAPIVIMEAMKMEHTIKASHDGKLISYLIEEGQLISGGKELFKFEGIES